MYTKTITIISFFTVLILIGASQSGFAEPVISEVSGAYYHNGEITITGRDFGAKSPAAPLWWDNMEGAPNGSTTFTSGELSWVTSGELSGNNKHYSEAIPNNGAETSAYMTYRSVGYRSVGGPHNYSHKYATGGHWQFPNNSPRYSDAPYQNVTLTVDSGTANKNTWFVHYYYRLDPRWTVINNYENHKKSAANFGTTIYDRPNCYVVSQGRSDGKVSGDQVLYSIANITGGACDVVETETGANAKDSWIALEQHWDSTGGSHEIWTWDGGAIGSGRKTYSNPSDPDCRNSKNNTRSFSLGGWYVTNDNVVEDNKRGHQDNFRYFDDVYVDNTFSRVVLANAPNYEDATIVEPQIPSAWNGDRITAKVNLGRLTDNDNVYLYIFDSNNNHNAVGYGISIGSGGPVDQYPTIAITSPVTGSSYSTLENMVDISGQATDDNGIVSVAWRNNNGGNGNATNTSGDWSSWSVPGIALQEGNNQITVTVTDSAGQEAIDLLTVVLSTGGTGGTGGTTRAYDANVMTGDDTWENSYVTYSARLLIPGSQISQSGNAIQLGFQGRNSGDYIIQRVSIAERDPNGGNGDIIDSTFTKITFDKKGERYSGQLSSDSWENYNVVVPANTEKLSNTIKFNMDSSKDYYVTFNIQSASVFLDPPSGYEELYMPGADNALNLDWSGLSYSTVRDYHALSSIYISDEAANPTGLQ